MATCRICHHEFQLTPQHEGFVNVCPVCSDGDVERLKAKVAWSGKHTVEIEIAKSAAEADAFNSVQKRNCAGPLRSILAGREPKAGQEARKDGSGTEAGALYWTPLGEKRSVKR